MSDLPLCTPQHVKKAADEPKRRTNTACTGSAAELRKEAAQGQKRLWQEFCQKELLPRAKKGCFIANVNADKFSSLTLAATEIRDIALKEGMKANCSGSQIEFALSTVPDLRKKAENKQDALFAAFVEAALLPLAKKGHLKADAEVQKKHFDYGSIGLDLNDVCQIGVRSGMNVERMTFEVRETRGHGPRGGTKDCFPVSVTKTDKQKLRFDWSSFKKLSKPAESQLEKLWLKFHKDVLLPKSKEGYTRADIDADVTSKIFVDLSMDEICALAETKGVNTLVKGRPGQWTNNCGCIEFEWGAE